MSIVLLYIPKFFLFLYLSVFSLRFLLFLPSFLQQTIRYYSFHHFSCVVWFKIWILYLTLNDIISQTESNSTIAFFALKHVPIVLIGFSHKHIQLWTPVVKEKCDNEKHETTRYTHTHTHTHRLTATWSSFTTSVDIFISCRCCRRRRILAQCAYILFGSTIWDCESVASGSVKDATKIYDVD